MTRGIVGTQENGSFPQSNQDRDRKDIRWRMRISSLTSRKTKTSIARLPGRLRGASHRGSMAFSIPAGQQRSLDRRPGRPAVRPVRDRTRSGSPVHSGGALRLREAFYDPAGIAPSRRTLRLPPEDPVRVRRGRPRAFHPGAVEVGAEPEHPGEAKSLLPRLSGNRSREFPQGRKTVHPPQFGRNGVDGLHRGETRAHQARVWFFPSVGESGSRLAPPRELSIRRKSLAGGSSLALLLCRCAFPGRNRNPRDRSPGALPVFGGKRRRMPRGGRPALRPLHPPGFPGAGETCPGAAVEGPGIRSFLLGRRGRQHSRLHPFRLHPVRMAAQGWRAETPAGHGPRGPGGCGDQPPDRTAAGVPPDP